VKSDEVLRRIGCVGVALTWISELQG